jgi:hypothetical protein
MSAERAGPFEHPPLQHGYPLDADERAQLEQALERRRHSEIVTPTPPPTQSQPPHGESSER